MYKDFFVVFLNFYETTLIDRIAYNLQLYEVPTRLNNGYDDKN